MEMVISNLLPLDARDGKLVAWIQKGSGEFVSVGQTQGPSGSGPGEVRFNFLLPEGGLQRALMTLEPPGDSDPDPSDYVLLSGDFKGSRASLTIEEAVTIFGPLETDPGSHSLFTTSNNVELGYPSLETSGIWMFTIVPSKNVHGTREVKVARLSRFWVYEGWVVKNYGSLGEVWVSYGKSRPDDGGLLSSRDDTGSGPFSGDEDYLNAGVEDVPGEEWTTARIADQLGLELPGGLQAPLMLDEVDPGTGDAVWTHVITIEPAFDEGEGFYTGRPFVLQPYRNPIGAGGPGSPRLINYEANEPTAEVRPRK
jgi:hypothetical protein